MPLLVPLCVASGGAVAMMADRMRAPVPWKTLVLPVTVGLVAAVVTWWPLQVDEGRGGEQTRRAVWMIEQARVDEALTYVALVEATHRHAGVLHFRVAEALATASRFDTAIDQYERAMAIDGQRPAIALPLGQALVVAGRPRDAVSPLTAAYDANYRREIAATWLARALALAGERDRAVALLDALPDDLADVRPDAAGELGAIALEIDAPDRAVRWYRLAVAHAPDRADVHDRLGAALLMVDEPGAALAPLETACRLDPRSTTARVNLALALARIGRLDDALMRAREAERLAPADPRVSDLVGMLTRARPH